MGSNVFPALQAGDIVCFGDSSWISRAIKWFTARGDDSPTKCSHVGIMYDEDRVCEALSKVRIQPVVPRIEEGGWREIYRPIAIKPGCEIARTAVQEQCEYYKGKSYGWWKNIAQAADGLIGGRYFFRRMLWMDNYPICSWLVGWVCKRLRKTLLRTTDHEYVAAMLELVGKKYFFGVPPNAATPDDIHDECQNTVRFTKVYSNEEAALESGTS